MPVSVGQTITASLWNAGVGVAFPHAEWTATSASVATATTASTGTLTLDATTTNTAGNSLATISTNTLTIAADGVYDFTAYLALSGAITAGGATYFTMFDGTSTWKVNATGTTSSQWGQAIVTGQRITAGTVLTFQFFHTSGASRILSTRLVATKTGTF